ncbi:unnamed protein product [Clonostachys rosea f. rosea IK726]|uniref:Uncharacterized protein n=1 Tax=Clonostachys rosea f. rosea IK726 TaxID=1349383 RepID=A0ACA9TNF7_BIOOC|nr:unnamed protein product [Clonostachys rosea f. rosea IK726]
MPGSLDSSRPIMAPSLPCPPSPNPLILFSIRTQNRVAATMPANTQTSRTKTRASLRFSTYSAAAPSLAATVETNDSATNEIRDIATGLDRMENKALSSQRVILSEEKTDSMQKLALGAKLDRALDRRMSSQDAVMRPRGKSSVNKTLDEKAQ